MRECYNKIMAYKNKEDKLEYNRAYREKNRSLMYKKAQTYRLGLKNKVLDHYGRECKQCSFSDYRALHVDHVDNNGAEEREKLGGKNFSGYRFYKYLIDQNFPIGYQILCANCNNIKQWEVTHNAP